MVTSNAFFSCPIGKFFVLKQDYEDGKSQQYAQTELDTSSADEKTKFLLIQNKGAVISMEILDMWEKWRLDYIQPFIDARKSLPLLGEYWTNSKLTKISKATVGFVINWNFYSREVKR